MSEARRLRVFLDANVLVAMGYRPAGDYRRILGFNFEFITTEEILYEVDHHLRELGAPSEEFIAQLRATFKGTDQVVKLPSGLPLHDDEDRQALAAAAASHCDEFVTFNSRDFKSLYGTRVLGVLVRHSGEFLRLHLTN